jgi:translation initiation factor 2A
MPAKAAIFDARANKIFDFGQSPKNYCRYSPQGRLVLLAGFGNLAGYIEVWDRKKLIKLSQFKEDNAVYCEFLPVEGRILTATLSPRLRVDNRIRVRSYVGEILWQHDFKELFQILQRPCDLTQFVNEDGLVFKPMAATEATANTSGGNGAVAIAADQTAKAYVPPHLRRKLEQQQQQTPAAVSGSKSETAKPAKAKPTQSAELNGVAGEIVKLEKQILGVKRKLRQLEQLREKQVTGEQLEKNQLDKLANESTLMEQLSSLEAQLSKIQLTA